MEPNGHIREYVRCQVVVFRVTTGEFGGLSNMAAGFPVEISDLRIPTIEALYQACRYPDFPLYQAEILDQPSPMTAKMKSKKYRDHTRPDWDNKRVSIMKWCLRLKLAQNWTRFGSILLKTDSKPIVEESKKDDFWGAKPKEDGTLVGMNVLGRLLMELREQLRGENNASLKSASPPGNVPNFKLLGRLIEPFEPRSEMSSDLAPIQPSMFNH